MSTDPKPPLAWQPLTPRGVAAFARARLGRLLLVQLAFAILAAAALAWTLRTDWFPVITAAIEKAPAQGEIRAGTLAWGGDSPQILAENRFLAVTVDLQHEGQARSPAHVQIEFGQSFARIFSLFGFVDKRYPRQWVIGFNRPELVPWWGAWAPMLLALTVGAVLLGLIASWAVLAGLYCWVVWLCAFFANRDATLRQSWHLAGAAQMPGALVMALGIVLYGLGALDPIQLLVASGLHFVVSWVYVFVSPIHLPRHPAAPPPAGVNPFDKTKAADSPAEGPR